MVDANAAVFYSDKQKDQRIKNVNNFKDKFEVKLLEGKYNEDAEACFKAITSKIRLFGEIDEQIVSYIIELTKLLHMIEQL